MKRERHYNKAHSEESVSIEHVNKRELLEKLEPLVDNTLMRYGLISVETELVKENHRWFLRIYIYSQERETNIDDCERVSRSLSDFLDALIPFKYNLEVSTPGLERKLKSEKEYVIFKGRDVQLKLKNSIDDSDDKQFVAKIIDYNNTEGLTVYTYKDKKNIVIKQDNINSVKLYMNEL